jgi:hypothetical protein
VSDNLPSTPDLGDLAHLASNMPHSHNDIPAILGVMVPIVAIVLGLGMGMLSLWLDFRKKRELFQLHHAERMAAIEKGIDLPPLPPEFFADQKRVDRGPTVYFRRGIMWLLIGIAVTVALWGTGEHEYWWGLIGVAVGVAYLLSYQVELRHPRTPERTPESDRPRPQGPL